jgi:hypothetical protein
MLRKTIVRHDHLSQLLAGPLFDDSYIDHRHGTLFRISGSTYPLLRVEGGLEGHLWDSSTTEGRVGRWNLAIYRSESTLGKNVAGCRYTSLTLLMRRKALKNGWDAMKNRRKMGGTSLER